MARQVTPTALDPRLGRLTRDNLPVGIQIVGSYLKDATPIAVAGKLADVTGGFQPPRGFA